MPLASPKASSLSPHDPDPVRAGVRIAVKRSRQHITQDISVTYNTSEDKAAQVFKSFMELVEGEDRAQRIARERVSPPSPRNNPHRWCGLRTFWS